ncbi:nuclear transport factor 2 family protein [Niabella beijingensis]|uniref:nuclear transport factor 2 family protein n=1 Tax=Niabella beijingensis TaxID=2872700 RepID=UPI001CBD3833|nr:nuclear transport factor 2 family protein [Niabella beijingensis]MBZ4188544.1 nuclear transport factor 2 family protein [Niabella beijingensis]
MKNQATALVLRFIEALNAENFPDARVCLREDFVFEGVLGKREGADLYIKEMTQMKLKYQVQQAFAAGEDVCLWYEIDMGGKMVLASGWYHTENGKILSLKVVFDPRPLLEGK